MIVAHKAKCNRNQDQDVVATAADKEHQQYFNHFD